MTGRPGPLIARWRIPHERIAVGIARDHAVHILGSWGFDAGDEDGPIETFRLLASEIITNGIVHGGDQNLTVVLQATGEQVTLAVFDGNPSGPARPVAVDDSLPLGGRGMFLVETYSDASGWYPVDDGKSVWFQLNVPLVPVPAAAGGHYADAAGTRQRRVVLERIRALRPTPRITVLAAAS